jgi:hypothetical protein
MENIEVIPATAARMTPQQLIKNARNEYQKASEAAKDMCWHILKCGAWLRALKAKLPHGEFRKSVEANTEYLGFGLRQSQEYMLMAEKYAILPTSRRREIEGLTSYRQIRDALLDRKPKQLTAAKHKKHPLDECDVRGCVVRNATVIRRCDEHMPLAFEEWASTATREQLEKILHSVSRLLDEASG